MQGFQVGYSVAQKAGEVKLTKSLCAKTGTTTATNSVSVINFSVSTVLARFHCFGSFLHSQKEIVSIRPNGKILIMLLAILLPIHKKGWLIIGQTPLTNAFIHIANHCSSAVM